MRKNESFEGPNEVKLHNFATVTQCGEGLDRPMCDEIKCIATHDTFEEPISQYFMLVYERLGNGNGCC